jgi:hypothetical protein
MIYSDSKSMKQRLTFSHCISGVFPKQYDLDLSACGGKLVVVNGELFTYDDLPDDGGSVLQRKLVADTIVNDACLSPKVLLIKTMRLASKSEVQPH